MHHTDIEELGDKLRCKFDLHTYLEQRCKYPAYTSESLPAFLLYSELFFAQHKELPAWVLIENSQRREGCFKNT